MTAPIEYQEPQDPGALQSYLLALRAGTHPLKRPIVPPQWLVIVESIERSYTKCNGNPQAMERVFGSLCESNTNLEELLNPPAPLARVESVRKLGVPTLPEEVQLPANLSQGACPLLDNYVAYSKKASPESYDEYHPFVGMWGLSAIANRRIYVPMGEARMYPNLIIALCGLSSYFAKSLVAKVSQSLLKKAGMEPLLYVDKRITPQKLLWEMSGAALDKDAYLVLSAEEQKIECQKLAMAGQKAIYYDEFGKMLKEVVSGKSSMAVYEQLFLELYNCPPTYSNATIVRGMKPVQSPFMTILGAMTPSNLRVIAATGAESWESGLYGRCSFLCPPIDAIVDETLRLKTMEIPYSLWRPVEEWNIRLGIPEIDLDIPQDDNGKVGTPTLTWIRPLVERQCTIDDDAEQAWGAYRVALRRMGRSKDVPNDLRTNYARMPETTLKFAMIMASLGNRDHIEMRHIAKAQELTEILRRNLHEMYEQINMPEQPRTIDDNLRDYLTSLNGRKITASDVKQYGPSHLRKLSAAQITKSFEDMAKAGQVEVYREQGKTAKRFFIPVLESPLQGDEEDF
jgi:hypothetical protein